jgi:hypothetical protein
MHNTNVLPHLTKVSAGPMWGPSVCVFCTRTGILCAYCVVGGCVWAGGCAAAAEEETSSGFDSSDITGFCSFSPFFFLLSPLFVFSFL